jgi:hypothetical protein
MLLLLLGAGDQGHLPLLERLLCWAIGVLAPAALVWRLPVDPWSLLVAQVPQRGRREIQQRLSALPPPPLLRLGSLVGFALLSLVLLWWCDDHAAFASSFSPVAQSPRLVGLLLAAALLALFQWQGQQVVQALWLLSRSPGEVATATPLSATALERQRLSPGLPLLLLPPLRDSLAAAPIASAASISPRSTAAVSSSQLEALAESQAEARAAITTDAQAGPEAEGVAESQVEGEAESQSQAASETMIVSEAWDQPPTADQAAPPPDQEPHGLETSLGHGSPMVEDHIPTAPAPIEHPATSISPSAGTAPVAVEPEQSTENQQGS